MQLLSGKDLVLANGNKEEMLNYSYSRLQPVDQFFLIYTSFNVSCPHYKVQQVAQTWLLNGTEDTSLCVPLCADVCRGPANGPATSTFLIRSTVPIWLLRSQLITGEQMPGSSERCCRNSNKQDGCNINPSADDSDSQE